VKTRPGERNERGASLIEFALVCPLLVLLLFGIVDFGTVFGEYLELRSAAREGARLAAVDNGCAADPGGCPADPARRHADLVAATREAATGLVDSTAVAVGISLPEGREVGKPVVVCLNLTVRSRTGIFASILDGRTLRSSARMRLEQAATFAQGTTSPPPSC
jgi:hypothetical protein